MRSAGPQAHPIFQPVTLNIFAALEMVTVRSAIPGNPAGRAIAGGSASVATMPIGLCGELTMIARVRGVSARRSASTSIANPRPSATNGTATR